MYNNVLVPVVFEPEDLAKRALVTARHLAGTDGTVTALHVIEQLPSYATQYVPSDILQQNRTELAAALHEMAETVGAGAQLVSGHASRTILDTAQELSADCIVIASHRPGLQDYLIGGTAAHIVRHATCAVHVLR
ncbi:MAG: universal stress protein [Pseudomonadota bacterium]